MTSRAQRILQNSMKINRKQQLQDDHEKVVKWLQTDVENEHTPRRSKRQHNAPIWHQAYTGPGVSKHFFISLIIMQKLALTVTGYSNI